MSLRDTLQEWDHVANVLDSVGHEQDARIVWSILENVRQSAADYLTFITEKEASIRADRSVRWVRERFERWEAEGHAKKDRLGRRLYRRVVVPQNNPEISQARKEALAIAER